MDMTAYLAKLEESGLSIEDAETLGIEFLPGSDTKQLHPSFKGCDSIVIPYFDHFGVPLPDQKKNAPFYRLRYLEKASGFDKLAPKKGGKYTQVPKTLPVAYYPRNQVQDMEGRPIAWGQLVKDTEEPLIITEGEFKAAKACKEGFPTIGLGGVYNWRALKRGVEWLESLKPIEWVRRRVFICFDSDYTTNPHIQKAMVSLADELEDRGADVLLITLPQLMNDQKTGLDDFLVQGGSHGKSMLLDLLAKAEPLGLSRTLFSLNERYVCVAYPTCVLDKHTLREISPDKFKTFIESDVKYIKRTFLKDGTPSYETVAAAPKWVKWPLRERVEEITYMPGANERCQKIMGNWQRPVTAWNTWPGWGCAPKEGDCALFTTLIDFLFRDVSVEIKDWFINWLAYPIQNPGVKLYTACVLHGIKHGVGKSLVGYTMKRIYGSNFREIKQKHLKNNKFNEWAINCQFVMGDDVTGSNQRQFADDLKSTITQEEILINKKNISEYKVPDCINYLFTSNQSDSFFLEDSDRRYFIHEVPRNPLPFDFYAKEYKPWLASEAGASALFHYFLQRDLSGFEPAAPALDTEAKSRMMDETRSDLAGWVRQIAGAPATYLSSNGEVLDRDIFTNKELLTFYDPLGKTKTTANGLGRELSRAGILKAANGRPVKTRHGIERYYIFQHSEKWLDAGHSDIRAYIDPLPDIGGEATKY